MILIDDNIDSLGSDVVLLHNVNVQNGSVEVDVKGNFSSLANTFVGVHVGCGEGGPRFYSNGLFFVLFCFVFLLFFKHHFFQDLLYGLSLLLRIWQARIS